MLREINDMERFTWSYELDPMEVLKIQTKGEFEEKQDNTDTQNTTRAI
jgi:hypothetical protein